MIHDTQLSGASDAAARDTLAREVAARVQARGRTFAVREMCDDGVGGIVTIAVGEHGLTVDGRRVAYESVRGVALAGLQVAIWLRGASDGLFEMETEEEAQRFCAALPEGLLAATMAPGEQAAQPLRLRTTYAALPGSRNTAASPDGAFSDASSESSGVHLVPKSLQQQLLLQLQQRRSQSGGGGIDTESPLRFNSGDGSHAGFGGYPAVAATASGARAPPGMWAPFHSNHAAGRQQQQQLQPPHYDADFGLASGRMGPAGAGGGGPGSGSGGISVSPARSRTSGRGGSSGREGRTSMGLGSGGGAGPVGDDTVTLRGRMTLSNTRYVMYAHAPSFAQQRLEDAAVHDIAKSLGVPQDWVTVNLRSAGPG